MARGPHPRDRMTAATARRLGTGKHADGGGLYLQVDDSGARRWVLRTTHHGRRREFGIGPFPLYSLAEAREMAREMKKVARSGGDPVAHRDRDKRKSVSFQDAARTVHREHIVPHSRSARLPRDWWGGIERYALPVIGSMPVHAIEQSDILRVLAPIWTEKPETARKLKQRLRTVLDWARTAGHREGMNPVEGVEKGLPKQRDRARHHKAVPWKDLPGMMADICDMDGMGALALRFTVLTAVRSGETRHATWGEIDLERKIWTIPEERMKGGREHRVPLSVAAIEVLEQAQAQAPRSEALVFPSTRPGRPLSDMTLAAVLKRLGVDATVHGMRSTFRDWAEEATSYPHQVKEMALAHVVKNKVEAAYLRTDLFEKRRDMMDAWASHVMSTGAKVVRIGA